MLRALSVGVPPLVIVYAKSVFWTGGLSYGPRYLGDLNVSLTLLLLPVVPLVRRSRVLLAGAAALVALSVVSHLYGALLLPTLSDAASFIEELWLWRRHPLVSLVAKPGPPEATLEPFLVMPRRIETGVAALLDRSVYHHDEILVAGVVAENATPGPLVLYAGFAAPPGRLMPHGLAVFIPSRGLLATPVDTRHRAWFRPLTTLGPGARFDAPALLRIYVHHALDAGRFVLFAALVEPGTKPWRVVAADVAAFEIWP